jgi:hypothetical protein
MFLLYAGLETMVVPPDSSHLSILIAEIMGGDGLVAARHLVHYGESRGRVNAVAVRWSEEMRLPTDLRVLKRDRMCSVFPLQKFIIPSKPWWSPLLHVKA